jgi:glutamate dehydrogenase
MGESSRNSLTPQMLRKAVSVEAAEFEKALLWLEKHMPANFLKEADLEMRIIVARNLLSYPLQDRFSQIHYKDVAIVLCQDAPDADLKILKNYSNHAIHYYRAFVSNEPPPKHTTGLLRVAILYLRDVEKGNKESAEEIRQYIEERQKNIPSRELAHLLQGLTPRFVRSLTRERLDMAIDVFFRAATRDDCQFELRKNDDWRQKESPSLQLVLAWRSVPQAGFLYRLAQVIHTHGLALSKVVAASIDPFSVDSVLILSLGINGLKGNAAWEEADIDDLMREVCLLKYFQTDDIFHEAFVKPKLLTGNEAHLVRNIASFVHQALLHADPNLYSHEHIVEGFCRHPDLTVQLCRIFEWKFHPRTNNSEKYHKLSSELLQMIERLDTGQASNDLRRKNILKMGLGFLRYTLKTNFYCPNKTAFSFRLDPQYLDDVPFDRREKFPELPYSVFFLRGMHFIGFNIRFKDLARGGFRTVTPERWEAYYSERNNIFLEAYNLSYTQQKKNKDIPEGGAKTVMLLAPFEVFYKEEALYRRDLEAEGLDPAAIEAKIGEYRNSHKKSYLFASQRSFIQSLMTLINCDEEGVLKDPSIVDMWQRPEYIYLGPDENMLNEMISWIADYASAVGYKPGHSFMSSKPKIGINHKEYGVTSYGVNVYLHQTLLYLGIDPTKQEFTLKISGGPDGDVAGNEIHILATQYKKTARLLALTDVSGTIRDPKGLDWDALDQLFREGKSIRFYPPEKLHDGSLLLDLQTKREESTYAQQTLCWRKDNGQLTQTWLSGSEMNHLFRSNVHQTQTHVFIPCGGRPRTLNETNYQTYLDSSGKPSSQAIVEGANLYLTPGARRALEKLGVIVLKDSSCNKGGVTCSSFEVLAGLCLSEEEFLHEKEQLVREVLEIIRIAALREATLILQTHKATGAYCTDLSEKVSERINYYKYQLLDHLETVTLSSDPSDPLIRCLFRYCPPVLRARYPERILQIPDLHKKAIISAFLASHLIYTRGLTWAPTIADVLQQVATDPLILGE